MMMLVTNLSWPPVEVHRVRFSRTEWRALRTLRDRYRQDRDLFSARERERLSFVRWLYCMGRVAV